MERLDREEVGDSMSDWEDLHSGPLGTWAWPSKMMKHWQLRKNAEKALRTIPEDFRERVTLKKILQEKIRILQGSGEGSDEGLGEGSTEGSGEGSEVGSGKGSEEGFGEGSGEGSEEGSGKGVSCGTGVWVRGKGFVFGKGEREEWLLAQLRAVERFDEKVETAELFARAELFRPEADFNFWMGQYTGVEDGYM